MLTSFQVLTLIHCVWHHVMLTGPSSSLRSLSCWERNQEWKSCGSVAQQLTVDLYLFIYCLAFDLAFVTLVLHSKTIKCAVSVVLSPKASHFVHNMLYSPNLSEISSCINTPNLVQMSWCFTQICLENESHIGDRWQQIFALVVVLMFLVTLSEP